MKKLMIATAAAVTLGVSAGAMAYGQPYPVEMGFTPNFYAGINLGWVDMNYDSVIPTGSISTPLGAVGTKVDDSGFAGRVFAGYEWNQYLATELGYSYFQKPKIKATVFGTTATASFTQQMIDADVKLMYPINNFVPFVKGGVGYVFRGNAKVAGASAGIGDDDKVVGLAGAGLGYNINRNLSVDVGYTRTFKNSDLPGMNIVTGGITWHFA